MYTSPLAPNNAYKSPIFPIQRASIINPLFPPTTVAVPPLIFIYSRNVMNKQTSMALAKLAFVFVSNALALAQRDPTG